MVGAPPSARIVAAAASAVAIVAAAPPSLAFVVPESKVVPTRVAILRPSRAAPSPSHRRRSRPATHSFLAEATTGGDPTDADADADADADDGWISLVDPESDVDALTSPVRKRILEKGEGGVPPLGSKVEIEYTGTLVGEAGWSVNDVVDCWLLNLQGLQQFASTFVENGIDGAKLMDDTYFTEEYCTNELDIGNKIQAKKLVMAARRLARAREEHPPGSVFDSSSGRGKNYAFVLGGGKVIKAMEMAASGMRVGERSLVVCRADYAYGSEGLRTAGGDVIVPPFATLQFELRLASATGGEEAP